MMPAAAPCSSTTRASCSRRACISWSTSSTPAVSGKAASSPARSRTGRSSGPSSKSRRWTMPTTSSRFPSCATGAREWPLRASARSASATGWSESSTNTSGRGRSTWSSVRSEISNAPSMISRCLAVNDACVPTSSRSSASVTSSRWTEGSPPMMRTTMSLDRDSSHTTGWVSIAIDRQRARRQQRPALGPLHGHPLGRQLADHQRGVRQQQRDHDDGHGAGGAAEEAQRVLEWLGQRHGGGRRRQEAGQRDADLDGGQEAVGVARQASHQCPGRRALLELLKLALSQRHQRHLGAREGGVEQHQHEDQPELQPEPAHDELEVGPGVEPDGGSDGCFTVP